MFLCSEVIFQKYQTDVFFISHPDITWTGSHSSIKAYRKGEGKCLLKKYRIRGVSIKGGKREKLPLLATKNRRKKERVGSRKSVEKEVCSDFPG